MYIFHRSKISKLAIFPKIKLLALLLWMYYSHSNSMELNCDMRNDLMPNFFIILLISIYCLTHLAINRP